MWCETHDSIGDEDTYCHKKRYDTDGWIEDACAYNKVPMLLVPKDAPRFVVKPPEGGLYDPPRRDDLLGIPAGVYYYGGE